VIRILIVDDQSMIRVGIRAILESQPDMTVVGEAENGRAGSTGTAASGRTWC
jgi:DNA-binding NarL/FixJ family response regulator